MLFTTLNVVEDLAYAASSDPKPAPIDSYGHFSRSERHENPPRDLRTTRAVTAESTTRALNEGGGIGNRDDR
jgi:hypothetical protein